MPKKVDEGVEVKAVTRTEDDADSAKRADTQESFIFSEKI